MDNAFIAKEGEGGRVGENDNTYSKKEGLLQSFIFVIIFRTTYTV